MELSKNCSKYLKDYIEMILDNKVEHCKEQELMIKNQVLPLLDRDDVVFHEDKVEEALALQKYFGFELIEWEVFLVACIVGFEYADGSDIYFNNIRIYVGRGTGKNGFVSFLVFYFLSPKHGVENYEISIMANSEEQAKGTTFKDLYNLIRYPKKEHEKAIKSNYNATKEVITGKVTRSEFKYETSSAIGKDSKRSGCIIFDEKHEYGPKAKKNINTLESGMGKIPFGRIITITSDGELREGVLDKEQEESTALLQEYDPNNRILIFWSRIEEEDEWKDPKKWVKAIPSINHPQFITLKRTVADEVRRMPYNMDYFTTFMCKRMMWPMGDKDIEIATREDIMATNQIVPDLTGHDAIGGVDYSKTNDFVGCALIIKHDAKIYGIQHTFICRKSRDLPGIKAPLDEWAERGDVEYVDDVEIPADMVAGWFEKQQEKFNIIAMSIDSYRYQLMSKGLRKIGFDAFEKKNLKLVRPQDFSRIIPVINSWIINHNLVWGDLPVMRWMMNNTKKIHTKNNNMVYDKIEPIYRKNDTWMAFAAAAVQEELLEDDVAEIEIPPPLIL